MSQNKKKDMFSASEQEFEIFGEHKTREQIKAEEKIRKEAERNALKERLKNSQPNWKAFEGKEWLTPVIVITVFVALLVGTLALAFSVSDTSERLQRDESNAAYYLDETAEPELSEEGITGAVREIYYTKGGHIAVKMLLGNGSDDHLRMTDIEVVLEKQDGTLVAGGKAEVTSEFVILTNADEEYTFYISPEHISEKVTSFTELNCTILATGVPTTEE